MPENIEQNLDLMESHLIGLKGQLETLRGWGESTNKKYQKFYLRTFGDRDNKEAFDSLYNEVNDLLKSGQIDK